MGEMRSSRQTEVSLKSTSHQLTDHKVGTELTTVWRSMVQSKAALRHIENRLEAAPGIGVLLDSVIDLPQKKSSGAVPCRDKKQADDNKVPSKHRRRSRQSPEKSTSRSPLRNTTQDSNVRRNNSVEFREPLASYREATPSPHPPSQLEAYSLQSVPGSSYPSSPPPLDPLLSQLVYQRDTRNKQTDREPDSTHSSALENTDIRYLSDQPALDILRPVRHQSHLTGVRVPAPERTEKESVPKVQQGMDSQESSLFVGAAQGTIHRGESTPSTSPGSASQRLENLRRHQPDDKLEKLKERIRRQRQHLEETAEREKLLGYLEQPIMAGVGSSNAGTSNKPTAKMRKIAAAPPAPIYKGFNCTETKIQTPDGKVWKEDEFNNISREIYRDLSRQFGEGARSRHQQPREQRADGSKERRPPKPVRKVHRAAPSSDLNAKPAISPASWREGQKLVKLVLGSVPKLPREDKLQPSDGLSKTAASRHRSCSDPRSDSKTRSRPNSTERTCSGFRGQSGSRSTPSSKERGKVSMGVSAEMLSADIQGILDDLQLECKAEEEEEEERARQRVRGRSSGRRGRGGSGSKTRTPFSAWGTTVASGSSSRGRHSPTPNIRRPETANTADVGHKKRHYDADTVRQYISRQQEERRRRQAEEKRTLREDAERRNQRLQELYRKQREMAKTVALPSETPVAPVQKRLQETYNKLLLEEAQLDEEATQTGLATPSIQMRTMYQPSGESDKENKRLEAPQSPSSSDRSLNDQPPPPLSRNDLDVGVVPFSEPDYLSSTIRPMTGPSNSALSPFGDHLLSQLLRQETAVAGGDIQRPATAPCNRSHSRLSRIEALKATAASLSNRIEYEARKFAGEGINYSTLNSTEVATNLDPRPSQANLGDENGVQTHPQTNCAVVLEHILNSHTLERSKLVNGLEKPGRSDEIGQKRGYGLIEDKNRTEVLDSSAGSISEGPLLSEGSISEDEASPPPFFSNLVPGPAGHLEAVDYCAGQRRDFQRLSEFQKEAARFSALSSQHNGAKSAWEELNKGSPLSVINIFTKNLHGNVRVSARNSPSAHSLHSGNGHVDAAVYEDDFVSSHSSETSSQLKRSSNSNSMNSHFEELMRRSPYERSIGGINSHQSPVHSPHFSSGSPSGSSPFSKRSTSKRGTASDQSDVTLVEEQRSSCSPPSDPLSCDSRKRGSDKSSAHSQAKSVHSNHVSEKNCHKSLGLDHKKISAPRSKQPSPSSSADTGSARGTDSNSEPVRSGYLGVNNSTAGITPRSGRAETKTTGELQYSPAALQQRMAAELQYLESIEESVRQLGDMERLMSVSMAQQESVSLAQMLKAKQQRHEHELYELKIKAEREALETQLQLEENRQRLARAHIELQEGLAGSQKGTLEGLQETTLKMMSQQTEAAQYTADAARQIKEMTQLVQSQMAGALVSPSIANDPALLDEQASSFSKQQEKIDCDSFQSEVSSRRIRQEEPLSLQNSPSHSDSLSFRRTNLSVPDSSSHHSPSHFSSEHSKLMKKDTLEGKWRKGGAEEREEREAGSTSIEEDVLTAANNSLCSDNILSVDDKGDSTSVATEYSLKFEESMTEDEIEERSFRSLLPSEAHRRGTKEKSRHREESEDDGATHKMELVSGAHNVLKSQDANMVFSGGQDSFSQFTMDMVRQYMKDEEVRLQHQSSLLRLRQKALKEKTKTELAWLEHQKKRLRDKGEDVKMPPIRKKQRGLLMKLQQEQAEIKRLQEANKAARKERQLLLKQQEEIEQMRNSTLRLRERLKCAGGEPPPETPLSETPVSEAAIPNIRPAEDVRSPSPSLSISGSETSSIMQKLRKMRSHMDEKHCSPVHYFFSVFTAHHWASLSVCLPNLHPKFQLFIYNQLVRFLTKREQQLMQRRHHAEELLQWKQRLDQEEAEVRRMEKEALAVWKGQMPQDKDKTDGHKIEISDVSLTPSHHQSSEPRTDSEKEYASEVDCSSATPEYSIHTEALGSKQTGSPSSVQPVLIPETPLASIQGSPANYTQDFTSASQSHSRQSLQSPFKGSPSPVGSPSDISSKTKMQLCSSSQTSSQVCTQPTDSPMALQIEPISDQSDIESRIKALKEELRKRKFMAYQLKKAQRKKHKEQLKAQEASLLKQLETYDNFIEKTKAELYKEPDARPDEKSQIKDSDSITERSSTTTDHRSETIKISGSERMQIDASSDRNALPQLDHTRAISVLEKSSEDPPTDTPVPVYVSPESPTTRPRGSLSTDGLLRPSSKEAQTRMIESDQKSEIQEELERGVGSKSEDKYSEYLFKLDRKEDKLDSQEKFATSELVSPVMSEEDHYSPSVISEQDKQIKANVSSKDEEAVKSNIMHSSMSHSSEMDLKIPSHQSYSFSSSDHSCLSDFVALTSKKKAPIKDVMASSTTADGYDDYLEPPTRGEHQSSKPASHTLASPTEIKGSRKDSPSRATTYDSQVSDLEEEVAEELSHYSLGSDVSHQSERLLDLQNKTPDLQNKHESKDAITSINTLLISPLQPPSSPVIDEMSSFYIGDRVLVGGVQPGTLRFKGPTSFANGFWAGVELDKSEGSNNGTYDGVVYFVCDESHGIFAPPDKITHLPDKFEIYTDTTEDDDSFFDDKGGDKHEREEDKLQKGHLKSKNEQASLKIHGFEDKNVTDNSVQMAGLHLNLQHYKQSKHLISNGNNKDIILDSEDALLTSDLDKTDLGKRNQKEINTPDKREHGDSHDTFNAIELCKDSRNDEGEPKDRVLLDTFTDKFLNNFVKDTVKQFAEIKKAKEQKIEAANQMNGDLFGVNVEEQEGLLSLDQKDGLPFFLPAKQEDLSSPELCNQPESPVLGASGQQELAKRLAELELSRDLLDELGDDQDWFDEDFGLSSRREQQRLKQKEEEARLGGGGELGSSGSGASLGGLVSSSVGEQQVKIPPRPELPLPLPPKLPEQPAMVVPHSATEVEKMVHAATQEIWKNCGLGKEGPLGLAQLPNPKPSQEYLGKEASSQDQDSLCVHSYKKAVYDLTWEMLQEIYAEDPNADQPQWVKPRRVKSSFYHRVKTPGDITKIQELIAAEVLKLFGLTKDQSQKTDWQKMLKFGRKKRDRVDHILVQELHEEEAQWVNYDEDELFVKMQLADSIFDALLKDTANTLTLTYDKRAKRHTLS